MNRLYLFILFILISSIGLGQKTSVAVFGFVCAKPEYNNRASQVQQIVIQELQKKSNISVIDRSMDTLLMKELDNQIREQSIASTNLVQQGKVLGAQYMIVGSVSNANVTEEKTTSRNPLGKGDITVKTYTANISFSLQVTDIETGKIISTKYFSNKDAKKFLENNGVDRTSEGAMEHAVKVTKRLILSWVNETFPPVISIERIEERDKKGFPKSVLVSGVDGSLSEDTKLILNEVEMITGKDGAVFRHTKKIGELKIIKVEGQLTLCKVTDGEDVLEAKINEKVKLEIVIK